MLITDRLKHLFIIDEILTILCITNLYTVFTEKKKDI